MTDLPAILGGVPVRAGKAWPAWPQWDERERQLLSAVLESGAWSASQGEQVSTWAAEFARLQGAAHGLAVTNGTQTMEAALAACGVGEGDEVIVPGITFVATASAALAVNATPVLVDVDADSLCLDVAAAAAAITPRTRAVIPVHVGGVTPDLDALRELCDRHRLALIEDCAHAQGSRWRGRGAGTIGEFGSFSFEAHKLITAGEGGALLTGDEQLRARAWSYVNCGRVEGEHWYHHASYGPNLRMSEWQGAVLRAQLERFPAQHACREARGALLDEALAAIPGVRPQPADPRLDARARYAYVFHYDAAQFAGLPLAGFERALAAEGIEVGVSYPSLNTLQVFREGNFGPRLRAAAPPIDYARVELPRAERAAASTVWLAHPMLLAEPEQVLDVARAVERVGGAADRVRRRWERGERFGARLGDRARRLASRLRSVPPARG